MNRATLKRRSPSKAKRAIMLPADPWGLQERILWRDGTALVLNKPAGLAVHGGPRLSETLETYLPLLGRHPAKPARLVHRLDQETSGCLLLAQTAATLRRLNSAFAERLIHKTYWAIVEGCPERSQGTIDAALLKHSSVHSGWQIRVDPRGQKARTHYQVLECRPNSSLVALVPETGRTHQLRVHMAHIGCPIMGDRLYGRDHNTGGPLKLHARSIDFPDATDTRHVVEAPPPPGFW